MFDRSDLTAAVDAGVLSAETASRLEAFLERRADPAGPATGEDLRFLANFNDIFISIGLVILISGLVGLLGLAFGFNGAAPSPALAAYSVFGPALLVCWGLAEYFCGRRRLLLPSITLTAFIALFAGFMASAALGSNLEPGDAASLTRAFGAVGRIGLSGFLGAGLGALAVFVRFGLPFALGLLAVALAGAIYTFTAVWGEIGLLLGGALSLFIGLATLAAAIWFDAQDPRRVTRKSDNAFWLHLAAAPQIILGLRGVLSGVGFAPSGPGEAAALLAALAAFSLLSLALNRRALIVSGLLTFGLALTVLIGDLTGSIGWTGVYVLLLVGGGVVLLGGGWATARRAVLAALPASPRLDRVFPPEPA